MLRIPSLVIFDVAMEKKVTEIEKIAELSHFNLSYFFAKVTRKMEFYSILTGLFESIK